MANSECRSSDRAALRPGFTALEVLMVIVIVALLVSIAIPAFRSAATRQEVKASRDSFAWLASRARTTAAERGRTAWLFVDPAINAGWIEVSDAGGATDTVQFVDFYGEFGTRIVTNPDIGVVTVCFTPKGFASQTCGSFASLPMDVDFVRGGESWRAKIWALGQVERL